MKKIIITGFLFSFVNVVFGQSEINIDSLFTTLNNNELYIAPRIGGLSITTRATLSKDSVPKSKSEIFVISSLPLTIEELVSIYSRDYLVNKLYLLLNDSQRDLYANAMLYYLSGNHKYLGKLMGIKRNEWVSSGKAAKDKKHWSDILKSNL